MSDIMRHDFKVGDLVVLDKGWFAPWYVKKYGLGIVIEDKGDSFLVHWQSDMRLLTHSYLQLKKLSEDYLELVNE